MIEEIRSKIDTGLLQVFTEVVGFGEWNKEKTEFTLYLEPTLLETYSEVTDLTNETNWNYEGVEETFFERLNILRKIGIISSYERDIFKKYNVDFPDYVEFDSKKWNSEEYLTQFESICKEKCGFYKVIADFSKFEILKKILYNTNSLELNISKRLLKIIIAFYTEKSYSNIDIFSSEPNIKEGYEPHLFDMEIMLDEIHIEDKDYIFNDFELFLYALAINNTKEHMAQLLVYLLEGVSSEQKEILIKVLKKEGVFHYYTDEQIEASNQAISTYYDIDEHGLDISTRVIESTIIKDRLLGNIGYRLDRKEKKEEVKIEENINSIISYDFKKRILDYNGKKISFSDSRIQAKLIEELYDNIGQWITTSYLKKKGFKSDIKSTKDNIFKNNFKGLSAVERKKLITFFTADNEEYIMMVRLNK